MRAEPGQRIVVKTPDRREYRGILVEVRAAADGSSVAVIKLDTGWVTSYPVHMVHPAEGGDASSL